MSIEILDCLKRKRDICIKKHNTQSKYGFYVDPPARLLNKKKLYLPSAVFIAQKLVGPSKQLKQIFQIEHNIVNNPNWPEANQLAIYKRGRGFELGATEKQIQVVARAGLEPGTTGMRVRHADNSATLPLAWVASAISTEGNGRI